MMSIGSLRLILIYPKFGYRQNMKVKMFKHHLLLLSANQRQNLPKKKSLIFIFSFQFPILARALLLNPPRPPKEKQSPFRV
jgi:hypothetical protein